MKKTRVSFYLDTCIKERLEELSRRTREPMGEYIHEALEDLLDKHKKADKAQAKTENDSRHPVEVGS